MFIRNNGVNRAALGVSLLVFTLLGCSAREDNESHDDAPNTALSDDTASTAENNQALIVQGVEVDSTSQTAPIANGLLTSLSGTEVLSFAMENDTMIALELLKNDGKIEDVVIGTNGDVLSQAESTQLYHSSVGLRSPNRTFVRAFSDNNYREGNCEITVFDNNTRDPIVTIPSAGSNGFAQTYCSTSAVDKFDNYTYLKGTETVSLDADGKVNWTVGNRYAPGAAITLADLGLVVYVDRNIDRSEMFITVLSTADGSTVASGLFDFSGSHAAPTRVPFQGRVTKLILPDADHLIFVNESDGSAGCTSRGPSCGFVEDKPGTEIHRIALADLSLQAHRHWGLDAYKGISNAIYNNEELAMSHLGTVSIIDANTFLDVSSIENTMGEVLYFDQTAVYTVMASEAGVMLYRYARL